ncbi:hypothetical protein C8R47DRAFT_1084266 [Mycena vitilis]|nr:hypothetical protein C8R47DRAFT_1084266 [Mycena vitilis]
MTEVEVALALGCDVRLMDGSDHHGSGHPPRVAGLTASKIDVECSPSLCDSQVHPATNGDGLRLNHGYPPTRPQSAGTRTRAHGSGQRRVRVRVERTLPAGHPW